MAVNGIVTDGWEQQAEILSRAISVIWPIFARRLFRET